MNAIGQLRGNRVKRNALHVGYRQGGSVANFNYGQNNRWSGRRLPGSFTVFETLSEQRYSLRQRARSDAKSPFNDACFSTDVAC